MSRSVYGVNKLLLFYLLVLINTGAEADDENTQFAKLLNSLVKLNENRLSTMKKWNLLNGDINSMSNALRSGPQNNAMEELLDNVDVLAVVAMKKHPSNSEVNARSLPSYINMTNNILRSSETANERLMDKNKNKTPFDNLNMTNCNLKFEEKEVLRKRWRSSCDRRAAKVCKKACIAAYKNVCMTYSCKRRQKRRFKKECKRSCKNKFYDDKSSDSDYFD